VEAAWLDQEEGGLGTAVDAHVVGVLAGCANPAAAREFVAFLLSEPTQALLAREFGETPVNPRADAGPVRPLDAIRRTDAPLAALIDRTPWAEAMLRRHGFEARA
jgi:ABC-type Fe3+ transport system substrate-binding protein